MDNWLNCMVALVIVIAIGLVCLMWAKDVVRRANASTHAILDEHRTEHDHALAQWQHWEQRAFAAERRAEEFRRLNSSILDERDKWQTLYWSQSAGAQGAQAMMMSTIDHLAAQLRALGKEVKIPAVIQATMDEFTERHVNSVSQEPGTPKILRPPQEGSQSA